MKSLRQHKIEYMTHDLGEKDIEHIINVLEIKLGIKDRRYRTIFTVGFAIVFTVSLVSSQQEPQAILLISLFVFYAIIINFIRLRYNERILTM